MPGVVTAMRHGLMLLSIDGTDRRTDGRTLDRLVMLTVCYADRLDFVQFILSDDSTILTFSLSAYYK